jgi:hypothetical protein
MVVILDAIVKLQLRGLPKSTVLVVVILVVLIRYGLI